MSEYTQAELAVRFQEWQRAEQAVLRRRHQFLSLPTRGREKALKRAISDEKRLKKKYQKYRDKLARRSKR